ncbi:hypothetical protein AB0L13_35055 [Saccharopolyspora shandongensis]|uniref:hypothetical protein n=1 Tax=Saccharopolyspora shandongensis TaxID=418495 RepID=UPI003423BA0E
MPIPTDVAISERRQIREQIHPGSGFWQRARQAAGCELTAPQDMHAGEGETSILLHAASSLVRDGYETADHRADERPDLLLRPAHRTIRTAATTRPMSQRSSCQLNNVGSEPTNSVATLSHRTEPLSR